MASSRAPIAASMRAMDNDEELIAVCLRTSPWSSSGCFTSQSYHVVFPDVNAHPAFRIMAAAGGCEKLLRDASSGNAECNSDRVLARSVPGSTESHTLKNLEPVVKVEEADSKHTP